LEHCPRILKIVFNSEKCSTLLRKSQLWTAAPFTFPVVQGVWHWCLGPTSTPVTSQMAMSKVKVICQHSPSLGVRIFVGLFVILP
jgi:hypothetical protein